MMSGLIELNALLVTQPKAQIYLCVPEITRDQILPMYFYLLSLLDRHHPSRISHLQRHSKPFHVHNETISKWCMATGITACRGNLRPTPYSRAQAISWFNNTIRMHIDCAVPSNLMRNTVLIIHRHRSRKRTIDNIEEVERALTLIGVNSELLMLQTNTSALQQLCLPISRPKVLAVHGAALSLFAFFAPPLFQRVELMPYGYNAPPYVDAGNANHLSLKLSRNESVGCGKQLQECVDREGSTADMTWTEVAALWWPRCRAHARNCNVHLSPATVQLIKLFFTPRLSSSGVYMP